MDNVFFDNPPILVGREEDQLRQLQRYLNAMSDKLNTALMSISIEQLAPEVKQTMTQAQETTAKNYESLKTLIIKTAEIVRNEMESITASLQKDVEMLSENYGSLEIRTKNDVELTALGLLQTYEVMENISELQQDSEDNKGYWANMNGSIFVGIIDQINHTLGIAIGQNITDSNGDLVDANKMATFTSTRLSFWHENVEVAYFSDNTFYISNGEIMQSLKMGNHTWKVLASGGLALISGGTNP